MDIRATLDLDKSSASPPAEPRRYLELPHKPAKSIKDGALALAKCGLRVLPVKPNGKRPWLRDWGRRATSDPAVIRGWFKRDPNINFGIVTGDESTRLLVLDVDPRHGGKATLAKLARQMRPPSIPLKAAVSEILWCAAMVLTPSGGRHCYWLVPEGCDIPRNSVGQLGPGLDIRGRGGCVVAPPSVINGVPYRWAQLGSFAGLAPDWLLDALAEPQGAAPGRTPESWLDLIVSGVAQGARNSSIASLAGKVFRYFPTAEFEMAAQLVAAWNAQCCRPPLDQDELRRTLDSIADREAKRRGLEP